MKTKFNKRAFISLVTMFLSIAVLLTGIMLLIMPDATLAYWNQWTFLRLEKSDWETFHAVVSVYFTIIVVFHILENSKALLSYMKSRTCENFKHKKELFLANFVSFLIIIGSFTPSPISQIEEVFETASQVWYLKENEPPFEDAQALPLNLLIKVLDLKEQEVINTFNVYNIDFKLSDSLEEISEKNDKSPKVLFNLIK